MAVMLLPSIVQALALFLLCFPLESLSTMPTDDKVAQIAVVGAGAYGTFAIGILTDMVSNFTDFHSSCPQAGGLRVGICPTRVGLWCVVVVVLIAIDRYLHARATEFEGTVLLDYRCDNGNWS